LATEHARTEGYRFGRVFWTKYYSLDDLEYPITLQGPLWVVHFDDFRDPITSIHPGLSVFVYEKDRKTEIPMSM